MRSIERVRRDAGKLGLGVQIVTFSKPTRTAQEAALACQCALAQIVKSMVFVRADDETLMLILVSGAHNADLKFLRKWFGCKLVPAPPDRVREQTGFAVGGVSPVGHLAPIPVFMDRALLEFDHVWAAAGQPNAVFRVDPARLREAVGAKVIDVVP